MTTTTQSDLEMATRNFNRAQRVVVVVVVDGPKQTGITRKLRGATSLRETFSLSSFIIIESFVHREDKEGEREKSFGVYRRNATGPFISSLHWVPFPSTFTDSIILSALPTNELSTYWGGEEETPPPPPSPPGELRRSTTGDLATHTLCVYMNTLSNSDAVRSIKLGPRVQGSSSISQQHPRCFSVNYQSTDISPVSPTHSVTCAGSTQNASKVSLIVELVSPGLLYQRATNVRHHRRSFIRFLRASTAARPVTYGLWARQPAN